MQEEIKPLLEQKKIPDPFIEYKKVLLAAYGSNNVGGILGRIFGRSGTTLVTKENAELGLLLINEHPQYKDQRSTWSNIPAVIHNGDRYTRLKQLLDDDWA